VSDYEILQKKRNVAVGIFVVGALVAIVWLLFKFGDLPVKISEWSSYTVYVQFPIAQGVGKSTPVRFCGYQVGMVTDVKPPKKLQNLRTGQFYHQAIVVLSIDKKYSDIPSNVDVKLMTRGLGSSYIELVLNPDAPPVKSQDANQPPKDYLTEGMWLQGSSGTTSEFFPAESQKKLDELITGLNSLIKNANNIIGDPNNRENIKVALANLAETTKRATTAMQEFEKFANAGAITFKDINEKVVPVVVSMSEELSKTTAEMRLILEKINSGQGTAGKFVNDGRFYESMLENTQQLESLLKEMRDFIAKSREKGLPIKLK
jgi:phospholipid/cholesterol/gamma-HCH transport system substrate-binding protein